MTKITGKISKNTITIDQLAPACRQFQEMREAGVTMNMAIRTLELFADSYAKLHMGGSATPHHVSQVELWPVNARKVRDSLPDAKPRDYFRVEHGTPRRAFALKVLELHRKGKLSTRTLNRMVKQYWKLAVITLQEDELLSKVARSEVFKTPEQRWQAAGIKF